MSTEKHFEYHREGRIAFVNFKRIPRSARDLEGMHHAFSDRCDEIESDDGIRVCVIKCIGRDACGAFDTRAEYRQWEQSTSFAPSIVESVAGLTLPVIICMDGEIKGPMLELALACDVRMATTESLFAFDHIGNGLIPFEGGTQRLPRIVGPGKALEMLLTGIAVEAEKAVGDGLIHRMVEKEAMDSAATEMAWQMGEKSPVSMMYAKEAIAKGMDLTLEQGLRLEADLYFLMHSTTDRVEGITAFKKKRKPVFKGQ